MTTCERSPSRISSSSAHDVLGAEPIECYVLGDGVWDRLAARRVRMLSIGVLFGGYSEDELTQAGAFRVYRDAEELHESLGELGVIR